VTSEFGYYFAVLNKYDYWMFENGLTEEQRIKPGTSINVAEKSFLRIGMGRTEEERQLGLFRRPYEVRMWIDGEELSVDKFLFYDKDGIFLGEPILWTIFYTMFDPGTFGLGDHYVELEFSWFDGYGRNKEKVTQYASYDFTVLNPYDYWLHENGLVVEQQIRPDVVIDQSEPSFVRGAITQTAEELENGWFFGPYNLRVWLDGEELEVNTFDFHDIYDHFLDEDLTWQIFYVIFDPNTLSSGPHYLEIEWSWFDDYGSGLEQIFWYNSWEFEVLNKYEYWLFENDLLEEQRIQPGAVIDVSQKSFVRPALGQSQWEFENGLFFGPYSIQAWLNGEELALDTFVFDDFEGFFGGEPIEWTIFPAIFEPETLALGNNVMNIEYNWFDEIDGELMPTSFNWEFEFSVVNPFEYWMFQNGLTEDQWLRPTFFEDSQGPLDVSQRSFISAKIAQSEEERENGEFYGPYDIRISLDGEDLSVENFQFFDSYDYFNELDLEWSVYYYIFDSESLELGTHALEIEWSWFNDFGAEPVSFTDYFEFEVLNPLEYWMNEHGQRINEGIVNWTLSNSSIFMAKFHPNQ
jgi:hypothetical protein